MTPDDKLRCETRARIIKALAHPSRLYIVEKVKEKAHCVCELAEMLGIDSSTTSKHLSILKSTGIIEDKKEGTTVYYSLRCHCILDFIGCIENVIRMNLERDLKMLGNQGAPGM